MILSFEDVKQGLGGSRFLFRKGSGKIYKIKRKEMTKGGSSLNLVGLGRYGSRYLSYISTY